MSGQIVGKEKSSVFLAKNIIRREVMLETLDIAQGHLPFRYLGAHIFKREPKGE